MKSRSLLTVFFVLFITPWTLAQDQASRPASSAPATRPPDPTPDQMHAWIDDYLSSRHYNTTSWTSTEYGPVERKDDGNFRMRFKYVSGVNDKPLTTYILFTFSPQGRWLAALTLHGISVTDRTTARITWRCDKDDHFNLNAARTVTITDTATLERLAQLFPDAGSENASSKSDSWLAAVQIDFLGGLSPNDRVRVVIDPDMKSWSEGQGNFPLTGDLKKELLALQWDEPPASAAAQNVTEAWGEPVGGVQVRLHPLRQAPNEQGSLTDARGLPRLAYDIRNVGNHPQDLGAHYQFLELEVDGRLYQYMMVNGPTGPSPPGSGYDNAEIPLGGWANYASREVLSLTPGKHTIRVAKSLSFFVLPLTPATTSAPATRRAPENVAYSNPITVEIPVAATRPN